MSTGLRLLPVVVGRLTTLPEPEWAESGGGGPLPDTRIDSYLPYAAYALVLLGARSQGWPLLHSALMHHRLLVVGEHCDCVIDTIKASADASGGAVSATAYDPERPDVSGFVCSWGACRLYVVHAQRPGCEWLPWSCKITEENWRMRVYRYWTPWQSTEFYGLRKE